MSRRTVGLTLLNIAGVLVIAGAMYDLLVPSVPINHLAYLGATDEQIDRRIAELDLAMLRSIGGCLLAIGATTLVLTNGPIRRGERWSRFAVAILVGVSEGNNAYRMFPFDSPWYGPLGFAVLAVIGRCLWAIGHLGKAILNTQNLVRAIIANDRPHTTGHAGPYPAVQRKSASEARKILRLSNPCSASHAFVPSGDPIARPFETHGSVDQPSCS